MYKLNLVQEIVSFTSYFLIGVQCEKEIGARERKTKKKKKKNLVVIVGLFRNVNHGEEAPLAGDLDPITASSFSRTKVWCDDVDYNFIVSREEWLRSRSVTYWIEDPTKCSSQGVEMCTRKIR